MVETRMLYEQIILKAYIYFMNATYGIYQERFASRKTKLICVESLLRKVYEDTVPIVNIPTNHNTAFGLSPLKLLISGQTCTC